MEPNSVSSESLRQALEMTPFLCILLNQSDKPTDKGRMGGWFWAWSGVVEACWIVAEAKSTSFPESSTMNCCVHCCISVNACSMDSWRDGSIEGKDGLDRVFGENVLTWEWDDQRQYPKHIHMGMQNRIQCVNRRMNDAVFKARNNVGGYTAISTLSWWKSCTVISTL